MSLDVPGIVLQRHRKVVECFWQFTSLEIDDPKITISFSYVVAFADCFHVMLGSCGITLLVQQQRFLKRSQQTRQATYLRPKQTQLTLKLRLDLTNALTL